MNVLVSGATGFIGSNLCEYLSQNGYKVYRLLRKKNLPSKNDFYWAPQLQIWEVPKELKIDVVVHLAGENIANKRWSAKQKQKILNSRVNSTKFLINKINCRLTNLPQVLICASAVGYYGDRGTEVLNESSTKGNGFLSRVVELWESSASSTHSKIRLCILRIGMVLSSKGGALQKMLPIFRFYLGGKLGSGTQIYSWISLQDLLRSIQFCIEKKQMHGAINIVSPHTVTNKQFTKNLASSLRVKAFLNVPKLAINLVLGELGKEILLTSACVQPQKLSHAGFKFSDKNIGEYLKKELR